MLNEAQAVSVIAGYLNYECAWAQATSLGKEYQAAWAWHVGEKAPITNPWQALVATDEEELARLTLNPTTKNDMLLALARNPNNPEATRLLYSQNTKAALYAAANPRSDSGKVKAMLRENPTLPKMIKGGWNQGAWAAQVLESHIELASMLASSTLVSLRTAVAGWPRMQPEAISIIEGNDQRSRACKKTALANPTLHKTTLGSTLLKGSGLARSVTGEECIETRNVTFEIMWAKSVLTGRRSGDTAVSLEKAHPYLVKSVIETLGANELAQAAWRIPGAGIGIPSAKTRIKAPLLKAAGTGVGRKAQKSAGEVAAILGDNPKSWATFINSAKNWQGESILQLAEKARQASK